MHILGLCNGSIGGNSEIVLKAALASASSTSASITTSWLHVPSIIFPRNAGALKNSPDISAGANTGNNHNGAAVSSSERDDRAKVLNAILDADALIFSTAVYSHQPAGPLKALLDTILGPYTDAALASRIVSADPSSRYFGMPIDARILKPRVGGFLAVGGATTPDQISMVLPTLHLFCSSLHIKIVDQVVFQGYANPGSVLASRGDEVVQRAQQLGSNVASQLGRAFDDAEYLGPRPEGACTACHLAKYDFFGGEQNAIGCVACGNTGRLVVDEHRRVRPVWDEESEFCCISMKGKQKHVDDIFVNGSAEWKGGMLNDAFEKKMKDWRARDCGKLDF